MSDQAPGGAGEKWLEKGIYLILKSILWDKYFYYTHYTHKNTEAQGRLGSSVTS